MTITPLKKRVLVAENADTTTSVHGILLDKADSVRDSRTGTVLAVGPDVTAVAVGDRVLLEWSKGSIVKVNGDQRVIINEDDIVVVIE